MAMNMFNDNAGLRKLLKNVSFTTALVVLLAGSLIIIGWVFNSAVLKSLHPDFVSMKANTAIGFILLGGACLLILFPLPASHDLKKRILMYRMASLLSGIVWVVAAMTIIQYLFGMNLGIDEFLFKDDPDATATYIPGRMGLNTAFGLLFLSTSLLIYLVKKNAIVINAQLLSLIVLLLSILPLFGYIYHFKDLYDFGLYTPMALHTAILFFLSSLSMLLLQPDQGLVAIFSGSGTGGYIARRLLPVAILIPIVLIWLQIIIDTQHIPLLPYKHSSLFIFIIIVFVWFVWRIALSLNRLDEEREQTQRQLQKTSSQLQLILEHAGIGIFAVNKEGVPVMVNKTTLDMLGYDNDGFMRKKLHEIHQHNRQDGTSFSTEECDLYQSFSRGKPATSDNETFLRKDGTHLSVEYISTPIRENNLVTGAVISFQDISEKKQAEQEIRNKNTFIQTVLDNLPIGIALNKFNEGEATYMNKKFEEIYGWDKGTMKDLHTFFESVYPDPEYRQKIIKRIMDDIQSGEPGRMHWENIMITTKDGSTRFINALNIPLFDQNTMVSTVIDITKQKLYEREITQMNAELEQKIDHRTQELQTANKELEAFTYSVSHDLRAPLRAIDGFTRILQEDYDRVLDDDGKRIANVIRDNTHKMKQLIDDLLNFSRISRMEIQRSEIDMDTLANSVYYELTTDEERERISFHTDHLPRAFGDPTMVRQVWVNLLSNALKFSAPKENPKINIFSTIHQGICTYTIRDNGVGFDMRYVDKLFGVFQRLHNARDFDGTGVGLAIVKKVIEKHGGTVSAESILDEYAAIHFSFHAKPI